MLTKIVNLTDTEADALKIAFEEYRLDAFVTEAAVTFHCSPEDAINRLRRANRAALADYGTLDAPIVVAIASVIEKVRGEGRGPSLPAFNAVMSEFFG